ncbi:MAG: hypothetical protein J6T64_05035 [Bacteroidaceae bacterium]|nr:hypothetical protein [Bacteroidaceae bacterium]
MDGNKITPIFAEKSDYGENGRSSEGRDVRAQSMQSRDSGSTEFHPSWAGRRNAAAGVPADAVRGLHGQGRL